MTSKSRVSALSLACMFKATMTGKGHTVEALPIEKTVEILKEHRVIK
jgi:hypothetical protein